MTMFKKLYLYITFLLVTSIYAQNKDEVLLTIEDKKVYTSEFIRIYEKNKDIVVEKEQKEFEDYFTLFVDFKLKLKQAKDLQLDTIKNYQDELIKYRDQLVEPYLQNSDAIEVLAKEAYERTITEVNASHILVRIKPNALPVDTLIAYNKISEARKKAMDGISFDKVANEYSEDPSVKMNDGNLGYFSAFNMVYPFENAAYNTEIGEVSNIFRTQFGYHFLKVNDKRKSKGEIEVSHIMVKQDANDTTFAKTKIFDIYNKLEQGDDFSKIAQEHSDDESSSKNGGKLPKFGSGKMIKEFDIVAFGLDKEGDFSEPFETKYGWHILKLEKKHPVKSYSELHESIESKIKNGNRAKFVEKDLALKLSKNYKIIENKGLLSAYYLSDLNKMKSDEILLSIEENKYTSNDFYNYFSKNNKTTVEEIYLDFKNNNIIDYYKEHLEETNSDFSIIYQEYKDGLLLFDLLQKNIWEKSEKDSIGLNDYFNANKNKYIWKTRGELTIASCTNLNKAEIVKKYLEEGKNTDEIKGLVNEGATIHVLFSSGSLEEGSTKLPNNYKFTLGVSKIYNENKNQFTILRVDKIIIPENKKLNETKGEVINDYQKYLEEQWVEQLRDTYKVKINKKEYKKLKKQFDLN